MIPSKLSAFTVPLPLMNNLIFSVFEKGCNYLLSLQWYFVHFRACCHDLLYVHVRIIMPVFDGDWLLCTFSGSGDCFVSVLGSERGRVDIPQGLSDQRDE